MSCSHHAVVLKLASINGRRHLEQLERDSASAQPPCDVCGHVRASYICSMCSRSAECGLCAKTLGRHDGHMAHVSLLKAPSTMPPTSYCNAFGERPLSLPYYHCTVCPDFDLCRDCEELNDRLVDAKQDVVLHDPLHVTVKIRTTRG